MANLNHAELTANNDLIHIPYEWSYADATARAAASLAAGDVGKLARQLDNNTLWMLTDDDPLTWVQVSVVSPVDNPMTTEGDIIIGGESGAPDRLALGTEGYVLKAGATAPEWAAGSGAADIGARVYKSAVQEISSASGTYLTFNQESYDTDTIHDNSTNNTRLTCKTAGKYLIIGNVQFEGNETGRRFVNITLNDTTAIGYAQNGVVSADPHRMQVTCIYPLAVNDYVELRVYQNSGVGLDVEVDNTWFQMQLLVAT